MNSSSFPDRTDDLGLFLKIAKIFSKDGHSATSLFETLDKERQIHAAMLQNCADVASNGICYKITDVITHGDLNLNSIVMTATADYLIDLEHTGIMRPIGDDVAYLFSRWGDTLWTEGFPPTKETPVPYPSLEARRAFARSYLREHVTARGARIGESVSVVSCQEVDSFLYQVEMFSLAQRSKILSIWLILANTNQTLSSILWPRIRIYEHLLPHVRSALDEAGTCSCLSLIKDQILEFGLVVVGARRASVADGTATTSCIFI